MSNRERKRGSYGPGPATRDWVVSGAFLVAAVCVGCGQSSSRQGAPPAGTPAAQGAKTPDAPSEAEPRTTTKLSLALNWFPESEHGGYFAAEVRGLYRAAGFEVTIQPGGPSAHMLEQVATGRADFGIANADNILFARAEQMPLVAIAAPLQNSPRCLLVHKESGIERFIQLRDVTLAMTPGAAFADFLRWKLPLPDVQIVPYSGSVEAFLRDPRYVQQGYTFSEPFLARQQGADPRILLLSDLDFNPYTSLLFTTEKMVATRPDVVRRMVAASVSGWQDYLHDPEPTNRLIHERNPVVDLEALEFGAREIAPLIVVGDATDEGIGGMTLERWKTLEHQLVESGQLTAGAVDPAKAFTTEFLPPAKDTGSPSP